MLQHNYKSDFHQLWKKLGDGSLASDETTTILCPDLESFFIDDGQTTATYPWLTPFHWAACAYLLHPKAKFVIDHGAGRPWEDFKMPFVDVLLALHPQARPWLTISSDPTSAPQAHRITPLGQDDIKALMRAQFTSREQRENHHSISNLILPLILNGQMPDAPKSDADSDNTFALAVMLRTLGLLSDATPPPPQIPAAELPRHVTLIDDMADMGWFDWVKKMLVGDKVQSVSPNAFWKTFRTEPCNFKSHILLLDLRLGNALADFVCRSFEEASEAWLDKAQALGKKAVQALNQDLAVIRKAKQADLHSPHKALSPTLQAQISSVQATLLARLVAVTLPRTPIVTFSSTQDAALLKRFEPFANIVTTFTKGTLVQAFEPEYAQSCALKFHIAIHKALRMAQVADLMATCESLPTSVNIRNRSESEGKGIHIELYIDETGAGRFMDIGGVIAIFRGTNTTDAIRKAGQFNRDFLLNHFCPFTWGAYKAKKLNLNELRSALNMEGRKKDYGLMDISSIRLASPDQKNHFSTLIADMQHHTMLKTLINLFTAVVVPSIRQGAGGDSCSLTASIFGPTRALPNNRNLNTRHFPYRYGFEACSNKNHETNPKPYIPDFIRTMGNQMVGQMAIESQVRFKRRLKNAQWHQCLAVGLAYEPGFDSRHAHGRRLDYVVDHENKWRVHINHPPYLPDTSPDPEQQDGLKPVDYSDIPGWEPECRALHYVADLALTPRGEKQSLVKFCKAWSFRDVNDSQAIETILRTAELLHESAKLDDLVKALLLMSPHAIEKPNGIARLLAADLVRLAQKTGTADQVVSAAFRNV